MRVVLELPETTMGIFVNYLYYDGEGMVMASTEVNGDDLLEGFKKCKEVRVYANKQQTERR